MPWSPISNGPSIEAKFKFTPSGAEPMPEHAVIESEPVKPKTVDRFVLMVKRSPSGWGTYDDYDTPADCAEAFSDFKEPCHWLDYRIVAVRGLPVGE